MPAHPDRVRRQYPDRAESSADEEPSTGREQAADPLDPQPAPGPAAPRPAVPTPRDPAAA